MRKLVALVIMVTAFLQSWGNSDFVPERRDSVNSKLYHQQIDPIIRIDSVTRDTLIISPIRPEDKIPLVYLPDSLIRDSLRYEFSKIKEFAYRARWTKELYKLIFVDPRPGYLNVMRTQNSEDRFRDYRDKIIRSLNIKILPPYGTSVYDTTYSEENLGLLKLIANKTHMTTAENVVRKQLTIRSGMLLNPFEFVQNEILLRELDFIDDAAFIVTQVESDTNMVDVLLICKDELSWGVELESNFINSFSVGLENKNFMKQGHIVFYEFSHNGRKDKKWGNILEYKVNSLLGTHINIRGYYRNDHHEKQVRAEIIRPFVTSQMKWAGGVAAGRIYYSEDLPDRNVTRLDELFNYHFQDVWVGRSFLMSSRYNYNRNLYLTGRFFTTFFNKRPYVANDTNHFYYNRLDYFTALTFTKIKYYKANLIYDFGRTEDVPTGLYLSFITGYENSEFDNYGYLGTEARYSYFNRNTERFVAVKAAIGSYMNDGGLERGLMKLEGNYISNLFNINNTKYRFYTDFEYIRGVRRYPQDYLYMEDFNIRGFSSDTLCGNQKLSGSMATTFFLPYIKKGFRVSLTSFVDCGIVTPRGKTIWKSKTYWGIGFGINFRNDNIAIKNLSLRLAFFPTIPDDGRSFQASMSGRRRNAFYDFRVAKPQVIEYK